ncbi:sigma-70 family RNA polymerase sigma factor [Streptomyces monashensis]|uniref:RNA polymerase sigma factor n=1 Tax=Streptomyces monashensis TaxID=1678012 RepID=A0A1S2Q7Y4_9ACTN|nr:sigma-70 family RNA polymerase sigma factor [Streptomyces monashensis]OIK02239.1 RNA polymerase [Streptomyces monashensis]
MSTQRTEETAALVNAARAGDPAAQDALVSAYLPLVYNIVGRALNGSIDVDDVVQETMLRALDALGDLRTPESFRSWLVAIAMNRVRAYRHNRQFAPADVEETGELADPGADFVDLTIMRLQLSGQRQETARATRWLEPDDQEVLSLWWLECTGELTRAEVATALELSPQHTAVRVQRMKARLEAARVVVRALDTRPPCEEQRALLATWDGLPSALWRKRIARHARDCARCGGLWQGLLPAEGLLAGLALVAVSSALLAATRSSVSTALAAATTPFPAQPGAAQARGGAGYGVPSAAGPYTGGYTAASPSSGPSDAAPAAASGEGPGGAGHRAKPGRQASRSKARQRRRIRRRAAGTAVAVAGLAGACIWYAGSNPAPHTTAAARSADDPSVDAAKPSAAPASSSATASPSASPTHTKKKSPVKQSPRPARTTDTPAPRPSVTTSAPVPPQAPPAASGEVAQVIALVNQQRAAAGCSPVSENADLDQAAQGHSDDMAARNYFDHVSPDGTDPGQRITAAGYHWSAYGENIAKGQSTPQAVMDAWMNSPGHRANILNCAFKELGVGVRRTADGPLWTQDFGTKL